jgi:hypothetical protein
MCDYLTLVVDSVLVQLSPAVRLDIHRGVLRHVADSLTVRVHVRRQVDLVN